MKKVVAKTKNKDVKKESEIEMLARVVRDGFDRIDNRFEKMNDRFEKLETKMDHKFGLVDSQLFNISHELKDHTQRLDRIERKQIGVREIFDNVVYKSEFQSLAHRVGVLEKKTAKK